MEHAESARWDVQNLRVDGVINVSTSIVEGG
jgi:hypothetical protein